MLALSPLFPSSGIAPWPPDARPSAALSRCLFLALLLHLWAVLWLGSAGGGSARPGEGVWGAINIRLAGNGSEPSAGAPAVALAPAGPDGKAATPRWGGRVRDAAAPAPSPDAAPGAERQGDFAPRAPTGPPDLLPARRGEVVTPDAAPETPETADATAPTAPIAPTAPAAPAAPISQAPITPPPLSPPPAAEPTAVLRAAPPAAASRRSDALTPLGAPATAAAAQLPSLPALGGPLAAPPRTLPGAADLPAAARRAAPLPSLTPLMQAAPRPEAAIDTPRAPDMAPLLAAPLAAPRAATRAAPLPTLPDTPAATAPLLAPLASVPDRVAAPPAAAPIPEPAAATPVAPARTSTPTPSAAAAAPAATAPSPAIAPSTSPAPANSSSPVAAPPGPTTVAPAVVAPGPGGLGRGAPDAGPQVGPDQATPPAPGSPPPRLNLDLPRSRAGQLPGGRPTGVLSLLPRPPEVPSKLSKDIEKAAKDDCRQAYSGAGLLAVIPLAVDAVRKEGCKW